ncbi:2,3-dihydro-2,3-dihydroxybenzoate dehydrogenase [Parafrankia sp. FMc6]|uniref:2,3-dihydro-2,3-dihydroxybenzoate dehydrogenase n=1 Tax=Parafrankia soli TaxID=2599596 RepID=UPI0034D76700
MTTTAQTKTAQTTTTPRAGGSTAPGGPSSGGVTLVTGAAGGIGVSVARALAVEGTPVALVDRSAEPLWRLADELAGAGRQVLAVAADVTVSADVDAAVAKVEAELGAIGGLVNAAGVLRTGAVTALADEDWEQTLAVNAGGVFHVCRAVARRMVPRGAGSIVTVASNAARTPRTGMAAYGASKAAATMITKVLGLELAGHGIRCNIVAPGSTRTPMLTALAGDAAERASIEGTAATFRLGIPTGRIAEPDQIADAVLFLLSDRAAQITLHELTVDGGATLGA